MSAPVKDYRVTIKVRNARLINALAEVGEVVGSKAALKMGISYAKLLALSNLRASPIDKEGNLIPEVIKLCEFTNKLPLDLFSPDQIAPLETNTAEVDMTAEDVQQLLLPSSGGGNPESLLMDAQSSAALRGLLDTIAPREAEVVRLRCGIDCDEHTYEEIGKVFGIGKERVRQIEAKAMRKLRHPSRTNMLRNTIAHLALPEKKENA